MIHVEFDELTAMASKQFGSGPKLQLMPPGTISSGLVQNPLSSTPYVPPTKNACNLLFQPMFDEYCNPPSSVVSRALDAAAPRPADPTGSPSSTSIDQATPSTSTSSTIQETLSLVNSEGWKLGKLLKEKEEYLTTKYNNFPKVQVKDLLAKQDLVRGFPKLKYAKDHLCSACQMGQNKKESHKPKQEPSLNAKLHMLHMDLCGPMRVESINGKKHILVIVDDYSQFTWVKNFRTKDETLEIIIKFLKQAQDALERQMRGFEYGEQDRKASILYEYETFKAIEGEHLLDTYLRYLQVINDLKKCGYKKDNCELNYKFLNNLQPEWKQYGTLMRQTKNIMDINIDALYNILKQNQGGVNDALGYKKKVVVITSDPLALVAEKMKVSKRMRKLLFLWILKKKNI
nr:ribonuclease H-like domain-containing protein [Tanacetum cinerariifolium]